MRSGLAKARAFDQSGLCMVEPYRGGGARRWRPVRYDSGARDCLANSVARESGQRPGSGGAEARRVPWERGRDGMAVDFDLPRLDPRDEAEKIALGDPAGGEQP